MLVLSLFPGADLLGMAFESQGFCVVRGPDILLGGDVRKFHAVAGKFDGVIGGPPCKIFSTALLGGSASTPNLIPEYVRIVKEAQPKWWVMENVVSAYDPDLPDWKKIVFDAHDVGANQHRYRGFWSNLTLKIDFCRLNQKRTDPWPTVLASEHKYGPREKKSTKASRKVGRRMTIEEVNEAMGLPVDFKTPALSIEMQYEVRGNGVPLQMGKAVAKAVKEALNAQNHSQ